MLRVLDGGGTSQVELLPPEVTASPHFMRGLALVMRVVRRPLFPSQSYNSPSSFWRGIDCQTTLGIVGGVGGSSVTKAKVFSNSVEFYFTDMNSKTFLMAKMAQQGQSLKWLSLVTTVALTTCYFEDGLSFKRHFWTERCGPWHKSRKTHNHVSPLSL